MTAHIRINDLLQLAVQEGASDLHLTVGVPPVLRINGTMVLIDSDPLQPEDTERLMHEITKDEHLQRVEEFGGTDFGFGFEDKARFRVSVLKQKHHYGVVMRQIPSKLMALEDIGLPSQVKELLFRPRGLVLVTGPTGSGKTTTLASMINIINDERDCHIVTVEDPVEYYHEHHKSIITQREVGVDVKSFALALRAVLRQDPDVILVGEMRDLETMEAAITAAETGHLVFATLHTTGSARTVDRIVDAFPTNQQEQVRVQLSATLIAVISQVLLPRSDKEGRAAAFEIMIATDSIRSLIRDGKTFRITSDIQTGGRLGMVTLDSSLMKLYEEGKIGLEDMIRVADNPSALIEKLEETGKSR